MNARQRWAYRRVACQGIRTIDDALRFGRLWQFERRDHLLYAQELARRGVDRSARRRSRRSQQRLIDELDEREDAFRVLMREVFEMLDELDEGTYETHHPATTNGIVQIMDDLLGRWPDAGPIQRRTERWVNPIPGRHDRYYALSWYLLVVPMYESGLLRPASLPETEVTAGCDHHCGEVMDLGLDDVIVVSRARSGLVWEAEPRPSEALAEGGALGSGHPVRHYDWYCRHDDDGGAELFIRIDGRTHWLRSDQTLEEDPTHRTLIR